MTYLWTLQNPTIQIKSIRLLLESGQDLEEQNTFPNKRSHLQLLKEVSKIGLNIVLAKLEMQIES